ncbi:MAG TPA: lanthionine synthetase LanC family protein [Caulobacteraceae bacterium]|jgi:lantibiotic modifying enzyme
MTINRRAWLGQAALTAAFLGLPPAWAGELKPDSKRPYLDLALQCAAWIEASRQVSDRGVRWPADPLKPESVEPDLYNGTAGVVVFLAELYNSTGDRRWMTSAEAGADYLMSEVAAQGDKIDCGLYSGLAGIGFAVASAATAGGDARYDRAGREIIGRVKARTQAVGAGVQWDDGYDVISGSAGIGLALLDAHRRWGDAEALALARKAGLRLIECGHAAEGGTLWFPSASLKTNYPNFSHGASGVGYFLASLHQRTGDRVFLDGALSAARYLDAIATRKGDGTLIFHHDPGGRDLYYLSWCHGPGGTARLFYRLHQTTGEQQWLDWVHSLTRGLIATGVPEQRSAGYWENISQCCGDTGMGQYFLDLERYLHDPKARAMIERVVADTLQRRTQDAAGLRWIQAENRTQPDNRVAQTGFMQGAAGVGAFLLRLDRTAAGKRWAIDFPDTPFVG